MAQILSGLCFCAHNRFLESQNRTGSRIFRFPIPRTRFKAGLQAPETPIKPVLKGVCASHPSIALVSVPGTRIGPICPFSGVTEKLRRGALGDPLNL
ncbi:hypothetical protein [Mameliella sp. MMSF_3455]|uniref:hypothetical protein n=1 Tax=Mameliella sp. MMSF_3455 TaxID=3046714 RepID=UPI00273D1E0A|nr:hypothetical protein [Mameliella sp. MMSF_3455]